MEGGCCVWQSMHIETLYKTDVGSLCLRTRCYVYEIGEMTEPNKTIVQMRIRAIIMLLIYGTQTQSYDFEFASELCMVRIELVSLCPSSTPLLS